MGKGRKRLFSTEQLNYIIDNYELDDGNSTTATEIAAYALKNKFKFGFENIDKIQGRHFRENTVISERLKCKSIDEKSRFIDNSVLAFSSYNIKLFVTKNIRNPLKLETELLNIQNGQKAMYRRIVKQNAYIKELERQIDNKAIEEAKSDIKKLKNDNKELKETVANLKLLIEVDNHISMCKFIWNNTYIEPTDLVDQYITTLLKCKVIKDSDVEEIKNSSDCIILGENENEEIFKIIEFANLTDKSSNNSNIEESNGDDIEDNEELSPIDLNEMLGYTNKK